MSGSSLPGPPELQACLDRLEQAQARGALTKSEYADEVLSAAVTWMSSSSSTARVAELYRDVASLDGTRVELLRWAYEHGDDADRVTLDPFVDERLAELLAQSSEALNHSDAFDLTRRAIQSRLGVPDPVRVFLAEGAPLSLTRRLALEVADHEGDAAEARSIITDDCNAGCTSLLSWWLARHPDDNDLVAGVDLPALISRGLWGDITAVAAALAAAGLDALALEWSGKVCDDAIAQLPQGHWPLRLGDHNGFMNMRESICYEIDARLFGPLALVDQLCGDPHRALTRAKRFDKGADPHGWETAAHEAIALWVIAEHETDPVARRGLLQAIDPSHTQLGLLHTQIRRDLAALWTDDDPGRAAGQATDVVSLHFGQFGYDHLLRRLTSSRSASELEP